MVSFKERSDTASTAGELVFRPFGAFAHSIIGSSPDTHAYIRALLLAPMHHPRTTAVYRSQKCILKECSVL